VHGPLSLVHNWAFTERFCNYTIHFVSNNLLLSYVLYVWCYLDKSLVSNPFLFFQNVFIVFRIRETVMNKQLKVAQTLSPSPLFSLQCGVVLSAGYGAVAVGGYEPPACSLLPNWWQAPEKPFTQLAAQGGPSLQRRAPGPSTQTTPMYNFVSLLLSLPFPPPSTPYLPVFPLPTRGASSFFLFRPAPLWHALAFKVFNSSFEVWFQSRANTAALWHCK